MITAAGEAAILHDLRSCRDMVDPLLRDKAEALWGVPLKFNDRSSG